MQLPHNKNPSPYANTHQASCKNQPPNPPPNPINLLARKPPAPKQSSNHPNQQSHHLQLPMPTPAPSEGAPRIQFKSPNKRSRIEKEGEKNELSEPMELDYCADNHSQG